MLKLWSETNPKALNQLKPDLGLRDWNDLNTNEKYKIWKFLEFYFFNKEKRVSNYPLESSYYFSKFDNFLDKNSLSQIIRQTINSLNEHHKYSSYGNKYLSNKTLDNACDDFYEIFHKQDQNVILELLAFYAKGLISFGIKNKTHLPQKNEETKDEYNKRFTDFKYTYFDAFCQRLNEVFEDFGLNILLTRQSFIPRQGVRIIEEIYKPTLDFLSDSKFNDVNREFSDALEDYHRKDFSGCVTKTVSTIQAFLQISINGEIGKGDISKLIPQAIKEKHIPDDIFTKTIFDNLESIIARERQETADSHPKVEYANERNARLILNIAMVFIQHFIQLQK